ncbi:MAG: sigma-70 family RNA polymerase sigma factor [Balneolaceae bacterium]
MERWLYSDSNGKKRIEIRIISMSPYLITQLTFVLFAAISNGMDEADEKELYRAIKNGNQIAFKKFFDKYFDSLYSFLTSQHVSPDVADDLIQTAFVYIWENRKQIKPDLSLKAYLFRIAYSRMINHFNSEKRLSGIEINSQVEQKNPSDHLEYLDLKSSLDQAIGKLPDKRKMVFTSCFIHELTYRETAEMLDLSIKTVETHMALALRDIRKSLKQFQ